MLRCLDVTPHSLVGGVGAVGGDTRSGEVGMRLLDETEEVRGLTPGRDRRGQLFMEVAAALFGQDDGYRLSRLERVLGVDRLAAFTRHGGDSLV